MQLKEIDKSLLQEIESNPRKQHKSYLIAIGLLDLINTLVPNDFKIKEKIDIILLDIYNKCFCGKLSKSDSKWCSLQCRNKDPEIRKNISEKNIENKISRSQSLKQTLQEKYNVSSVQDIPEVKIKTAVSKKEYYNQTRKDTFNKYNLDIELLSDKQYLDEICRESSYSELSNFYFNQMPIMTIYRHFEYIDYEPNFNKSSSAGQRQVQEFLSSLGIDYITENRTIIKPYEIDIFIPEYNLGIEFNGLYFHNSLKKSKDYHKMKSLLCKEKGIFLIHLFEDEWIFKQEIVKSIIKSKLGLLDKIFARKTVIKIVSGCDAKNFYNTNHIQGYATCSFHYGLYYESELISLMSIGKLRNKKSDTMLELVRFCNKLDYSVIGGFSKLLKYAKNQLNCPILTFADLRFFDGSVYDKFGIYSHTTDIGYYWVDSSCTKRYSRYMTQKHKLQKFLGDKFNVNLTEEENMIESGYTKIFDCGNIAYIL